MLLPCKCSHEYQDKTYGKGVRVHNKALKGFNSGIGWRCTVCKDVKAGKKEDE